jgi:hypothetical protein
VEKALDIMLKRAKAQVEATEELLRWNRKTLHEAEAVVEQVKRDAIACKRLRVIRANFKRRKCK